MTLRWPSWKYLLFVLGLYGGAGAIAGILFMLGVLIFSVLRHFNIC